MLSAYGGDVTTVNSFYHSWGLDGNLLNAFNDGGEKDSGGHVDEDGNFREDEL